MKHLKKLYLLALLVLVITAVPTQAMTQTEASSLVSEVQRTCREFGGRCTIKVNPDTGLKAYSDNTNTITISQGMLNRLPVNQGRAVLYHEMSHLLLQHPQTWQRVVTSPVFADTVYTTKLRHSHEYEADAYASFLLYANGYSNDLSQALLNIIPPQVHHVSSWSHPSTLNRIKRINEFERIYPINYKFKVR